MLVSGPSIQFHDGNLISSEVCTYFKLYTTLSTRKLNLSMIFIQIKTKKEKEPML